MKLLAPVGTTSFSYGGVEAFVDADGTVDVDGEAVEALQSLGFTTAVTIETMTKGDLIERIMAFGRAKVEAMSIEDLRTQYAAVSEFERKAADAAQVNPDAVTAEQIDGMNRSELFAYLRQKGIAAGAVGNEALKTIAKDALIDEAQAAEAAEAARLANEQAEKDKAEAAAKAALNAAAKATADAAKAAADAKTKADEDAAKAKSAPAAPASPAA